MIESSDMQPGSPGYYDSRYPVVHLPPNDPNVYAAGVASGSWDTANSAHSFTLLLESVGIPTTVHANFSTAGTFGAGDALTVTVTGYDWQYKALTESFVIDGDTDTAGRTGSLFSRVTAVDILVTEGSLATATVEIGIGDGTASPDIGVLAPWHVPDGVVWASAPAFKYVTMAAGYTEIVPDGETDERYGVTVDYAASTTPKVVQAVWQGSQFDFNMR